MGMFDFLKKKEEVIEEVDGFFVTSEQTMNKDKTDVNPNFKGEVEKKEVKFPVMLGEQHPFDFSVAEGLYKKMGLVAGVVDKYIDFVVGPGFFIECDDEAAKKIIDDFMVDVNFDTLLRGWIKEGLVKGNGFMELGGKKDEAVKGIKVLDANWMYVKRDEMGVVEGYNQYVGGFKKFDERKVIPFKPYKIAHIALNKIGDDAYGGGMVYSAMTDLNHLLQSESNLHMLMDRKANSPYDVTMGKVVGGKYIKPTEKSINDMGKKLEMLHNKHEWTHDGLTEIKVLDFGNIGEKFETVLEHDLEKIFYAFQVPPVIMGKANVPEGLAEAQMDGFERRINSIQAEVEKVVERDIFQRILQANGFDVHVEFQWGRPSSMEKMKRIEKLTNLIKIPTISGSLVKLMEKDIVKMLDYNEDEFETMSKEEERKREEERSQPIVPGQNETPPQPVPPAKGQPKPPVQQSLHSHVDESLDKYNAISEWLGFNYTEYVAAIKSSIQGFDFSDLIANTSAEELAGRFSAVQVRRLKEVLEEGFTRGLSISEIARNIDKRVKPKDLLKMEGGTIVKDAGGSAIISKAAKTRSIVIARSEVTRLANMGAIKHFKEGGVKKIRWVASYGSRTCPECDALDNQIFNVADHPSIPLHAMCRCTVVPVTEVV